MTNAPEQVCQEAARALRRDPAARLIVRRWRALSGGRRTLVACSGGADSTALALALALAGAGIALGHIVHDMRPSEEALDDAERVRALGRRLGAQALLGEARRAPGENVEASLRRGRYAALAALAQEAGADVVAAAHHADDQLESILLALARGAGPRGLSGAAPQRPLPCGATLIRPMLEVQRSDAERLCRLAGVAWCEDPTNLDAERARGALRRSALPALLELHPHAPIAATRAGDLLRDAAGLVGDRAAEVFGEGFTWRRDDLRRERAVVVGEGLRRAALRLTRGVGADRLGARRVEQAVRAIRDDDGRRRAFQWPGGVRLDLTGRTVTMRGDADATRKEIDA